MVSDLVEGLIRLGSRSFWGGFTVDLGLVQELASIDFTKVLLFLFWGAPLGLVGVCLK